MRLISAGKFVSDAVTLLWSMVMDFRYCHPLGSHVSQPWTAAVVATGVQVWVPSAVFREMIRAKLPAVLTLPGPAIPPFIVEPLAIM